MSQRRSRNFIRVLVGAALCAALVAFALAPVPDGLPAVALQQPVLYRLEVALSVFYGGLLLVTPAVSGLINGHLPVEISTRGAKFAEEFDHSDEASRAAIEKLERSSNRLAERVAATENSIARIRKGVTTGD
ncbi:MAG TPA: hypothetical protein VFR75_00825 [Solirubrobacterales bacterium]|nr:hypothetical protein [Solirubrobacterales bacterium]